MLTQYMTETNVVVSPSSPTDNHSHLSESSDNSPPDSIFDTTALVQVISTASSEELLKVVQLIFPQVDDWIVDIDLSLLPLDKLEQIQTIFQGRC